MAAARTTSDDATIVALRADVALQIARRFGRPAADALESPLAAVRSTN